MENLLKGMLWGFAIGAVVSGIMVAKNKKLARKINEGIDDAEEKIQDMKENIEEKIKESKEQELDSDKDFKKNQSKNIKIG